MTSGLGNQRSIQLSYAGLTFNIAILSRDIEWAISVAEIDAKAMSLILVAALPNSRYDKPHEK